MRRKTALQGRNRASSTHIINYYNKKASVTVQATDKSKESWQVKINA